MKGVAIIVAAGKGERLGDTVPKQFVSVRDRMIVEYSLAVFASSPSIDSIVVVVPPGTSEGLVDRLMSYKKVDAVVPGGKTRQDSVIAGFRAVKGEPEVVLVHDGARPLVTVEIIESVFSEARSKGAAIPALNVSDALKYSTDGISVEKTVDRSLFYRAQTPQGVRFELFKKAIEKVEEMEVVCADEAQMVELLGEKVSLVNGSERNLKVTYPDDLVLFKALLGDISGRFRVGIGYDAHRLVEGRPMFLGGVEIEFERGLLGHSDGDCALHAIADALLGAAGLGDIGKLFPPGDPTIEGISSREILRRVVEELGSEGYSVINVDCVIVCERPRISDYSDRMRKVVSGILGITPDNISIKGKTTEGMGFEGTGEGISSIAVALLEHTGGDR